MQEDFTAVENLLREMLSERFDGEITFGPIIAEAKKLHYDDWDEHDEDYEIDESLNITVVFQGDRKKLHSRWGTADELALWKRTYWELNEVRHPIIYWVSPKEWERRCQRLERARR